LNESHRPLLHTRSHRPLLHTRQIPTYEHQHLRPTIRPTSLLRAPHLHNAAHPSGSSCQSWSTTSRPSPDPYSHPTISTASTPSTTNALRTGLASRLAIWNPPMRCTSIERLELSRVTLNASHWSSEVRPAGRRLTGLPATCHPTLCAHLPPSR